MPLITFEGIDGAGKTSTIQAVAEQLLAKSDVTAVIGSDACKHAVVAQQMKPYWTNEANPHAQYAAVLAARAISTKAWLRPALHSGEVVLYDRYVDTTLAYQGVQGVDPARIMQDHIDLQLPTPDLTVILDLPAYLVRTRIRYAKDHIETFDEDFFDNVRNRFLSFPTELGRHVVVDATMPQSYVVSQCLKHIYTRVLRPNAIVDTAGQPALLSP